MTLPPSRSVVAITRPAPSGRSQLSFTQSSNIVHDRVLVRPSMRGLSRAGSLRTASHKTIHALAASPPSEARPRLRAARLRRCSLSPPKAARTPAALVPRYSDSRDELAHLCPLLARPPAEGCTRSLRSLRARAFGPVALSFVARRALCLYPSMPGQRRVVTIPLLSRYFPSRLRCTSLPDIFHSLNPHDVI
ncbi:uncharacterized protein SCHCODRAFT_01144257 [Schizophyllum commune H4-8]|nr:uncharacterized protein SCHCODRAFT_01144257 [Schizophyllum commune H4-8]KAI5900682.1 hypothetical protein SCHCODRAFT_01144257 [Schizophyllum commune H4-8]